MNKLKDIAVGFITETLGIALILVAVVGFLLTGTN